MSESKETCIADDVSSVSARGAAKGENSPDIASVTGEEEETTSHSRSVTAVSASTSTTAVSPQPQKKDDREDDESSIPKGSNLIGKINNLVTSDLEQLAEGRDFLFVGKMN